jgi:hypothetical protein
MQGGVVDVLFAYELILSLIIVGFIETIHKFPVHKLLADGFMFSNHFTLFQKVFPQVIVTIIV